MSYTKQTWQSGDTITAQKLNHIEDGIADGGVLVVNSVHDEQTHTTTLGKTWQEIMNTAYFIVVLNSSDDPETPSQVLIAGSGRGYDGEIGYYVDAGDTTYTTDSPDGYPVSDDGK